MTRGHAADPPREGASASSGARKPTRDDGSPLTPAAASRLGTAVSARTGKVPGSAADGPFAMLSPIAVELEPPVTVPASGEIQGAASLADAAPAVPSPRPLAPDPPSGALNPRACCRAVGCRTASTLFFPVCSCPAGPCPPPTTTEVVCRPAQNATIAVATSPAQRHRCAALPRRTTGNHETSPPYLDP